MAVKKRYHICINDGRLTAATNAVKDSVLDPRGGGLDSFSVPLRRIPTGDLWWGASWVMWDENPTPGVDDISFEVFQRDIIDGLNMKHNTGAQNVQIVTYVHEDEFPGMSPPAAFAAVLADTVKKPFALEEIPQGPA